MPGLLCVYILSKKLVFVPLTAAVHRGCLVLVCNMPMDTHSHYARSPIVADPGSASSGMFQCMQFLLIYLTCPI